MFAATVGRAKRRSVYIVVVVVFYYSRCSLLCNQRRSVFSVVSPSTKKNLPSEGVLSKQKENVLRSCFMLKQLIDRLLLAAG